MKKSVIFRKKEEFMAESGERVEVWVKHGRVEMEVNPEAEQNEDIELERMFQGSILIMTEIGPKEIKFSIPNVDTVEEAFKAFPVAVEEVIEELERQREEAIRKAQSQIIQAPADAMNQLNRLQQTQKGNPKIHIP